ncbi:MAG: MBL fold metallo-hydrolase [Patescibacteria group bacterium]
MHLIFLGTGPANPIPRKGCECVSCREARSGGRSARLRSAALLRIGSKNILLDAGPDILKQIKRERIKKIDAALLTHGHSDAAHGIAKLDGWLERHSLSPVPIWTDNPTRERLKKRFKQLNNLKFKELQAGKTISIGKARIRPFSVLHGLSGDFPAYGFVYKKTLAYASDVSKIPAASGRFLKGVKIFVLDGAMYLNKRMYSHLAADQSIDLAAKLKISRLILTQIGHSYPPHSVAQKHIRKYLAQRKTSKPVQVTLAYDGMRITGG